MKRLTPFIDGQYVLEDDSPCSKIYKIFKNKKEVENYLNKHKQKNDWNMRKG